MTFRIESAIAPSVSAAVVSSASSLMRGGSVFGGFWLWLWSSFFSLNGGERRITRSLFALMYTVCILYAKRIGVSNYK
jgi:hypothetical protein